MPHSLATKKKMLMMTWIEISWDGVGWSTDSWSWSNLFYMDIIWNWHEKVIKDLILEISLKF